MNRTFKGFALMLGVASALGLSATAHAGIVVTYSANTVGSSVDLTAYDNYVHFTGANTNLANHCATLSGGLPDVAVIEGTAFHDFSAAMTFCGNQGEIGGTDSTVSDTLISSGGTSNALWYTGWGTTDNVSFEVTLPSTSGEIVVHVGGFSGGADIFGGTGGGISLSAYNTGGGSVGVSTFLNPAYSYYGGHFTVSYTGEGIGDTVLINVTTVPLACCGSTFGNAGVIGAYLDAEAEAAPAPGALALLALGLFGLGVRRRRKF